MEPVLSTDEDINLFFDDVVSELQNNFGYSETDASELVRQYYSFFKDPKSCAAIGVPVQDEDFFFHESAGGMALRIYYYMVLKENPDPQAFIKWRASLQRRSK